ncbi:MAG: PKD domain-containing protein [Candidatus Pacebacteria bacterium]|nr:PKD domain-containing protein [Candidatus Paceibacterota bacterium]
MVERLKYLLLYSSAIVFGLSFFTQNTGAYVPGYGCTYDQGCLIGPVFDTDINASPSTADSSVQFNVFGITGQFLDFCPNEIGNGGKGYVTAFRHLENNQAIITDSDIPSLIGQTIGVSYSGGAYGSCPTAPDPSYLGSYSKGAPVNFNGNGVFDSSGFPNGDHYVAVRITDDTFSDQTNEQVIPFAVNHPSTPSGTVCISSNTSTHIDTSGPSGYSDDVTGDAGYTCHGGSDVGDYTATGSSIGGYNGPSYYPSQTQTLSDGGTIYFDLTYSQIPNDPLTVSLSVDSVCGDDAYYTPSWTSNGDSFEIYYRRWSGGAWNYVDTVSGSPYGAIRLSKGTTYYFYVLAKKSGSSDMASNVVDGVTCAVPTVSISANPATVAYGAASTLTWSPSDAGICTASGDWSGGKNAGGDSESTGALTSAKTYTITCTDAWDGYGASDSVTVNVGAPIYGCTDPAASNYNASANIDNGSCTYVCPPPSSEETGCDSPANACGQTASGTKTRSRTCNTSNGTYGDWSGYSSCSASTPANTCTPTATITADSNTVGYNGSTTIRWNCDNSSAGTVPGIGSGVSGYGGTGGLTSNTTYTLTCNGYNGSNTTASTTVSVSGPTCSINANGVSGPITVPWNSNVTINWSSTNAGSGTVTPPGWSGTSGSQTTGNITTPGTYVYTATFSGNGTASCNEFVTVSPPVPILLGAPTYSPPDYCSVGPGGTISWGYSDPSGSPQTAYEVKIGGWSSGKINSSSHVYSFPNGTLSFGQTYNNTEVRVWNSYDQVSDWSSYVASYSTPPYAYPEVEPPYQFTWATTPRPQQNKPIQFYANSLFSSGGQWLWNFGDGGTSSAENPSHTYAAIGAYNVTLTATDAANQSCPYTQSVNIQKPIPVIKEVAPK